VKIEPFVRVPEFVSRNFLDKFAKTLKGRHPLPNSSDRVMCTTECYI